MSGSTSIMTKEELKAHCKKQIEMCEMWAISKGELKKPSGKIYEEHKLILELLEQETVSKEVYDHEYFLRKEFELKIAKLEHDKNEVLDKIRAEIDKIYKRKGNSVNCLNALDELKWFIDKYKAEEG